MERAQIASVTRALTLRDLSTKALEDGVAVDLAEPGSVLLDGVALRLSAALAAFSALIAGVVVVRGHASIVGARVERGSPPQERGRPRPQNVRMTDDVSSSRF